MKIYTFKKVVLYILVTAIVVIFFIAITRLLNNNHTNEAKTEYESNDVKDLYEIKTKASFCRRIRRMG